MQVFPPQPCHNLFLSYPSLYTFVCAGALWICVFNWVYRRLLYPFTSFPRQVLMPKIPSWQATLFDNIISLYTEELLEVVIEYPICMCLEDEVVVDASGVARDVFLQFFLKHISIYLMAHLFYTKLYMLRWAWQHFLHWVQWHHMPT